jgi:hypothetical protein
MFGNLAQISMRNNNSGEKYLLYSYVFSSTKLENRAEQVLPGSKVGEGKRKEERAGGRDGPNNVCTYE